MKHLHLQFILAALALGLGCAFVLGAMWSVHALSIVGWTPIRVFLSAVLSSLVGSILIAYGSTGVRKEVLSAAS
jgi:hypothetical protein